LLLPVFPNLGDTERNMSIRRPIVFAVRQRIRRQIHTVLKLAAFDRVQCTAGSGIAGPQALNVGNDWEYVTFEGRRFLHVDE
jgi:hypothetical protein